jgi:hypothetical protein
MASFVKVTVLTEITENGVTTVDREFIHEYEVSGKVEGSYWLDAVTPQVTLCVKGTDLATGGPGGAAITDPMVVGLSKIRGFALDSDINLNLRFDSAAEAVDVAEGNAAFAQTDISILEIAANDTRSGEVRFVVWGDR